MRHLRWAGLVGAVVFVVGFFMVSSVPGGGDVDSADFEKYYVTDDDTALAIAGLLILSAGLILLVLFLHYLRAHVPSDLSQLGFVAGVAGFAVLGAGACLLAAPSAVQVFGDEEYVGQQVAHTFAAAGFLVMLIPAALLIGLAIAAYSIGGRLSGALPAWVSIIGYIVALLQLIAIIYLPFLVVPVWMALASIAGAGRRGVVATP
ncbi:MAG: hypothetical protein ABIQ73_28255 [Acidimicrobiales bacterium]